MTAAATELKSSAIQVREQIEYPQQGVLSKVLLKDQVCQYTLFCLAAGTDIEKHTAARNATVNVIEGTGTLTLEGTKVNLCPGVFVFMAANMPHSLKANTNLAFLLTLSEKPQAHLKK